MSEKEIKEFSQAIKKFSKKISKSKEESKKFLVRTGIITEKGKFTAPYKNLCIQPDQG